MRAGSLLAGLSQSAGLSLACTVFSQIVWPSFIETSSRELWIVKSRPTYCACTYVTTFFSAAITYNLAHVESLSNSVASRRHAVTLLRGDHAIYNYIKCSRTPSDVWHQFKTKYFNQKQNGSFAVHRWKGARDKELEMMKLRLVM